MEKRELLKRIGSIDSFCRADEFVFDSGKARGSRGIRVKCGDLSFTVLPDRCMDIAYCEYKGMPMSFDADCGIVSPAYFNEKDYSRSFTAGLLTTCGLSNTGAPCTDEGKFYGQHGRISNTPASDVSVLRCWKDDDYYITISGRMKQTVLFGEKLELKRTITVKLGESKINIHDEVVNNGFSTEGLMLLYHINFGYPLIDEGSVLHTNTQNLRARDEETLKGIDNAHVFCAPQHDYKEQVFYHDSVKASWVKIVNEKLRIFSEVSYDTKNLPYLIEWKQMGEGDYVVGIEPGTNPPEGRKVEREKGRLRYIEAGETKQFDVTIKFGETEKERQ